MVTDRDVCMAGYTKGLPLRAITASEVMSRDVFCCAPEDLVTSAEEVMRQRQVRRLPVVDSSGQLVGILSLNDIVRAAGGSKGRDGVSAEAVEATLAAIGRHRDALSLSPG